MVRESQDTEQLYDKFYEIYCGAMQASRRKGGIMLNLHHFFFVNQGKLFGTTAGANNWHLKNNPSAIVDMAALYCETREIISYFEDLEHGEMLLEEDHVLERHPETVGSEPGSLRRIPPSSRGVPNDPRSDRYHDHE